jgi:hypothetical protein
MKNKHMGWGNETTKILCFQLKNNKKLQNVQRILKRLAMTVA